jgi:hypothetical protein
VEEGLMTNLKTLRSSTDFRPALLWLMGQLESAAMLETLAEFEKPRAGCSSATHRTPQCCHCRSMPSKPCGELPVARIPGGGDQYLPLEEPVRIVQL